MLMPFTIQICKDVINEDFCALFAMGLRRGISWPDTDVLETMPKIISNLSGVEAPTGYESWMVIKKDSLEIIGDLGFKGFNHEQQNVDLGYGIIEEERRNGYAEEAARGLIKWVFSQAFVKEITARCRVNNAASINLLKKSNFTEVKQDNEMVYWSLTLPR